jgi:phosphatidylserine decarboxylase
LYYSFFILLHKYWKFGYKIKMKDFFLSLFLPWLPKNLVSYWVGRITEIRWPEPLGSELVRWFAQRYQIDLQEAEKPIEDYPTINALFTRRLKAGIRPIGMGIVHPADARVTEHGIVEQGQILQVKGHKYSVAQLLASEEDARIVEGGYFITYYLCPTDYHRVHSPVSGQIKFCRHIPGQLWPVNEWSTTRVKNLFAINERTVTCIKVNEGWVFLVMVGATNVGKISMSFDQRITTNIRLPRPEVQTYYNEVTIEKGQEMGVFNMGSTVVMLYSAEMVPVVGAVEVGICRMGASL